MSEPRHRVRSWFGVLVLVVVATAVVACGDDSSGGDGDDDRAAGSGVQVALEPVGSTGEDPFTDSVAIAETAQLPAATDAAIAATLATATPDPTTGGITTTGTTPGLYGGTGDTTTCNVDTLTTYLTDPANTTKAAAFATVLGITPDTITDTLATFTPVVLTIDTLVTNHGFRNNTANPFPAILQAGTAVLVDQTGTPRVKCGCGNPLTPPPTNTDLTTTTGTPWTTFDPTTTATITPAPQPTDTLTLLDTTTGDTYQHPTGSGPSSEPIDPATVLLPENVCYPDPRHTEYPTSATHPPVQMEPSGEDPAGGYAEVTDSDGFTYTVWSSAGLAGDFGADGVVETVLVVECFNQAAANLRGTFVGLVTLRPGAGGAPVAVGGTLPVSIGPEVTSAGNVLTATGLTYGPDDTTVDGPTVTQTDAWLWNGDGWDRA